MDEKKPYHLYVVLPSDIAESEKRYLITPDWCLLYTQNDPPARHEEVTDMAKLPSIAREWLDSTIEEIRKEYLVKHREQMLRRAGEFTKRFAAELAVEKELAEKEAVADADT